MDRLDAMSVLLAAVEAGSLSAAARKLGTPLSTVSRKVSELEAHLNARLLIRASRKLVLTDAGRSYVDACRKILADLQDAERAVAGEYSAPRGDLVITAPVVFGRLHVLPVVAAFLDAYPEIDVKLILADRITHLVEDHIDVALRIGSLPDSSFKAIRIGEIRRVVCASPAYVSAHGAPSTPQSLAAHRCIMFNGLGAPDGWTFRVAGADLTIPIRPRLSVNTAEAAIDAAAAGIGVTRILSYQAEQARRSGLLTLLLEAFEPAPSPVSLVYPAQGLLPLKLRAFLDFATPRLRTAVANAAPARD